MRTLIDLPEDQIIALKRLSAHEGVSRSALIRRAIARMISTDSPAVDDDAFGSWAGGEEGLAYEDRLRAEW